MVGAAKNNSCPAKLQGKGLPDQGADWSYFISNGNIMILIYSKCYSTNVPDSAALN